MLKKVDYDEHQYAVYAKGRALSDRTAQVWRSEFAGCAGPRRPQTVLDLGSGTGRFTPLLAGVLGGPVYGVEPSARMREVAEMHGGHPAVRYLAGRAEDIPLPDDACDLVLMFLSLQHVVDRTAAASEIARVLRGGGHVLIRSTFADRMPDLLWHKYFPRARSIEQELFPTLSGTVDLFAAVGLEVVSMHLVREYLAPGLAAYTERLRLRAVSVFEHLTEEEIGQGFAAMDAAVRAEGTPRPVEQDGDLLVLASRP
jgi:ubiquinone/menaquinone biosynthesis C-methylase UbiE